MIAVAFKEYEKWGCPHCGFRSGTSTISAGGAATFLCGECGRECILLADGLKASPIGIGSDASAISYPELVAHPRTGTPNHGRPDTRPVAGEHFNSRGIGREFNLSCFVCGGELDLQHNIAAFVRCKAAGERVVSMFKAGARLDYREFEPDRVQVKIGACDSHLANLQALHLSTAADGIISVERIDAAVKLDGVSNG